MKTWQKRPEQYTMPAELEFRYETVKMYIQKKRITTFREIFKHIPKTVVALDMHTNGNRMTNLMQRPWEMTYRQGYFLAELIGIEHKILSAIIENSEKEEEEVLSKKTNKGNNSTGSRKRKKTGARELAPGKV